MDPLILSPILFAGILAGAALFAALIVFGDRRAVKVEHTHRPQPRRR